jgi:hypothetical protein
MIKLECFTTFEDAMRHARALCKLGYGALIDINNDGMFQLSYLPKS